MKLKIDFDSQPFWGMAQIAYLLIIQNETKKMNLLTLHNKNCKIINAVQNVIHVNLSFMEDNERRSTLQIQFQLDSKIKFHIINW